MGGPAVGRATTRRWRRAEYERLVELGMFTGERLELLQGQLVVREPQGSAHAALAAHIGAVLGAVFGSGWHARLHAPLALDPDSEPEPDVAVVAGTAREYLAAHPATAALVVEIADSSLRLDRRVKASLYARAGIPEYWIVNLAARVVEVHRDPGARVSVRPGARYRSVTVVAPPAAIFPLARPDARVATADLLP